MVVWLADWLVDGLTGCLVDWLTCWQAELDDWLTGWLVGWLSDWQTDLCSLGGWLFGWLTDWLTDWRTACLPVRPSGSFCVNVAFDETRRHPQGRCLCCERIPDLAGCLSSVCDVCPFVRRPPSSLSLSCPNFSCSLCRHALCMHSVQSKACGLG